MASTTYRCRIASLQVQGFKCYANSVHLDGLQLGNGLTCVIGPNGCGKSVLGDAIAFALGGNKKMLRANTLNALVNQDVLAKTNASAQVTLELRATSTDGQEVSILVQRTLSWQGICKAETRIKLSNKSSSNHASSLEGQWQTVNHAQLQQHLLTYGINNRVVDRYVVAQQSQAVAVADPVALLQHLEVLLGTDHLAAQLSTCEQQLGEAANEAMQLEEQQKRLSERKRQLAPMVARWIQLNEDEAALVPRKTLHLQQAISWLEWAVRESHVQELTLKQSSEQAQRKLQQATEKYDEVNAKHRTVTAGLTQARAKLVGLNSQVEQYIAEVSKLKGQLEGGKTSVTQKRRRLDTLRQQLPDTERAVQHAAEAAAKLQHNQSDAAKDVKLLEQQVKQAAAALQKATNEMRNDELTQSATAVQHASLKLSDAECEMEKHRSKLEGNMQKVLACEAAVSAAQEITARCHEEVQISEEHVKAAQEECAQFKHLSVSADQQVREAEAAHMEAQVRLQLAKSACTAHMPDFQPLVSGKQKHSSKETTQVHGNRPSDTMDQAVENLMKKSQLGLLPGQFLGRMHSIFSLVDEQYAVAVNAAISTVCNLRSTVAVSDRDTALAVISHVAAAKAGIVTCKVLSELEVWLGQQQEVTTATECAKALGIELRHLAALCKTVPELEQAAALLSHLLGNWYMVPDRDAAQKLIAASPSPRVRLQKQVPLHGRSERAMPRINIVTSSGEIFRADGEIVAGVDGTSSRSGGYDYQRYNIQAVQPDARPSNLSSSEAPHKAKHSKKGSGSAANAVHQQHADEKDRQDMERRLQAEFKQAEKACRDATQHLTAVRTQHKETHEKVAAARARLSKYMQELGAAKRRLGNAIKEANTAQFKVKAVIESTNAMKIQTDRDIAKQEVQINSLRQELKHLREDYQKLLAKQQQQTGKQLIDPQQLQERLHALQQQLKSAQHYSAMVDKELRQALATSKTVAARYSELRAEWEHAQKALEDAEKTILTTTTKLQHSSNKLSELQKKCVEKQQEVEEMTSHEESLGAEVKQLHDARNSYSAALAEHRDLLHKAQAKGRDLQKELDNTRQKLAVHTVKKDASVMMEIGPDRLKKAGEAKEQLEEILSRPTPSSSIHAHSSSKHKPAVSVSQPQTHRGKHQTVSISKDDIQMGDSEQSIAATECSAEMVAGDGWLVEQVDTSCKTLKEAAADSHVDKLSDSPPAEPSHLAGMKRPVMAGHDAASPTSNWVQQENQSKRNTRSSRNSNSSNISKRPASITEAVKPTAQESMKQSRGKNRHKRNCKANDTRTADQQAASEDDNVLDMQEPCSKEHLNAEKEAIVAEEARLADERNMINPSDIEEDNSITAQLELLSEQLESSEKRQEQLRQTLEDLITERFDKMCAALQAINARLSPVYSFLTGNHGDAYLGFALEKRLLFAQGVTLHVRPDAQHWRAFTALSGGQQALASLALSFAMQESLLSPFVFLDEVDCALDTHCAARVAEYLASGGNLPTSNKGNQAEFKPAASTQYIVVSHRPQVFERASRLIGVYSTSPGVSDAVALHC